MYYRGGGVSRIQYNTILYYIILYYYGSTESSPRTTALVVGTRTGKFLSQTHTKFSIVTGIQIGATRAAAEGDRPVSEADFYTKDEHRVSLISEGAGDSSSSAAKPFTFTDFAPRVFYALRRQVSQFSIFFPIQKKSPFENRP